MKTYTLSEFEEIQDKQNYKYISLVDKEGQIIVHFNNVHKSIDDRLNEIKLRFASPQMPEGFYFIKCKNSPSKTVVTDDYLIKHGEGDIIPPIVTPVETLSEKQSTSILSYENALQLEVENAKLKLENEALKKEVEELEEQIEELEEQIEKEEQLLDEQPTQPDWQSFLTETLQMVTPMLDKHFELKEQRLKLDTVRYMQNMNGNGQQQQQHEVDTTALNFVDNKIQGFIQSKQDNPETYEALAQIYNTSENIEHFYQQLDQYNNDLFLELQEVLNNGQNEE